MLKEFAEVVALLCAVFAVAALWISVFLVGITVRAATLMLSINVLAPLVIAVPTISFPQAMVVACFHGLCSIVLSAFLPKVRVKKTA